MEINPKHEKWSRWHSLKNIFLVITYTLLLLYLVLNVNISVLLQALRNLLGTLSPFIIGFILAYILNRPLQVVEEKLLKGMDKSKSPKLRKLKKPLAVVLIYLALFALIAAFLGIVIPQLASSAYVLVDGISGYTATAEKFVQNLILEYNLTGDLWAELSAAWQEITKALGGLVSKLVPGLVSLLTGLTTGVANAFLGFIVSVYLLLGQDKLKLQCKRALYAFFPVSTADNLREITTLTHKTFGSFIIGQVTVAAILGTLCFLSMVVLRMPYAMLISVIVGFTNIIPYFGPFIGAVPGVFILMTVNPMQALFFILLVVVLQQVDNNFVSPKIVGGNLGLSGLWVLFAITVGGGLLGIPGMIIGAPTFAVIYTLIGRAIEKRLAKKNLKIGE